MNKKIDGKEDLDYILNKINLKSLPKKETKEQIWTKAICRVSKKDGTISYGLMKMNPMLEKNIVMLLGTVSPINEIISIHPYEFLDMQKVQTFNDDNKDDRIKYLQSLELPYANKFNFIDMSIEDLNKQIVCAAIYLQNYN